jgi:protein-S-isoprenylcysteine O-methyltransferase Ste14
MLYAFMSFPLLITHSMQPMLRGSFHQAAYSVCLVVATIGLALQIVGDTHKALAKAKGEGLVTTGLFSIIRHPNYLGELILWSASTAASLVVAGSPSLKFSFNLLLLSLGSILGSLGLT